MDTTATKQHKELHRQYLDIGTGVRNMLTPGRVNARALLTLLEKGGELPDASKKIVIDSLAAAAAPTSVDREISQSNRHSFRAAISWLRKAPGRLILRARETHSPRPGAYQRRRPIAAPFHPGNEYKKRVFDERFSAKMVAARPDVFPGGLEPTC